MWEKTPKARKTRMEQRKSPETMTKLVKKKKKRK